jgi:hypothetical protein
MWCSLCSARKHSAPAARDQHAPVASHVQVIVVAQRDGLQVRIIAGVYVEAITNTGRIEHKHVSQCPVASDANAIAEVAELLCTAIVVGSVSPVVSPFPIK